MYRFAPVAEYSMAAVSGIFCIPHRRYSGVIEVVISYVPEIQCVFVVRTWVYRINNSFEQWALVRVEFVFDECLVDDKVQPNCLQWYGGPFRRVTSWAGRFTDVTFIETWIFVLQTGYHTIVSGSWHLVRGCPPPECSLYCVELGPQVFCFKRASLCRSDKCPSCLIGITFVNLSAYYCRLKTFVSIKKIIEIVLFPTLASNLVSR